MTLNDLNTMQKADKYTQDGRDQIIKAQKETEDKVYQIGEISQKTGLQKTANGWVQPKNGAAGKKSEDKWQKNKNDFGRDRLTMKTRQGGQIHIYETENPKQKNARFRVDGGTHYNDFNTLEEAKAFAEKHWGTEESPTKRESVGSTEKKEEIGKFYTKFDDVQGAYDAGRQTFPEGGYTIFKTPEGQYKVVDDPKIKQRMQDAGYEVEVDVPDGTKPPKNPAPKSATTGQNKLAEIAKISGNYKPENLHAEVTPKGNIAIIEKKADGQTHNIMTVNPKAYHIDLAELDEEGILDRPNYEEDSAPRVLTGDTRLRLSQVTDRVYKPGEISEKTGLQKQTDGSWAPPKNGALKQKGGEAGKFQGRNTAFNSEMRRTLNNNVAEAFGKKGLDVSTENRKTNEAAEKSRAERAARANKEVSKASKEAQSKGLTGAQYKDFMLAKTYEGISIGMTQNGMERQGWDLLESNDSKNVYGKPDGSRVTFGIQNGKTTKADYKPRNQQPNGTKTPAASQKPAGSNMEKYSATTQINSGKHDDALIETMGDDEAIEDLARDIVGNTEKLSEEKQAEVSSRVAGELRDRYKALQRESTEPAKDSAPRQLTGDCKIRVKK